MTEKGKKKKVKDKRSSKGRMNKHAKRVEEDQLLPEQGISGKEKSIYQPLKRT